MLDLLAEDKKILLDVDTGIDDALAIILAYQYLPDNIIGITTCGGNVGVNQTTRNTLAVVSLIEAKIPVYKGSANPLKKSYIKASDYHGEAGLANVSLPVKNRAKNKTASEFIMQASKEHKENLVFISLAPPTNLARAIIKDKRIKNYLSKVYLMGGAINVPGNQTRYAEFNFFQDPEAVKIIFNNIDNVSLIPLDVTKRCIITQKDIKKFTSNEINDFVVQAINNWYNYFGKPNQRKFELYDPLAISVVLGDFLKFKKIKADINIDDRRGAIITGDYAINYAYQINAEAFKKFFIKSFNNLE